MGVLRQQPTAYCRFHPTIGSWLQEFLGTNNLRPTTDGRSCPTSDENVQENSPARISAAFPNRQEQSFVETPKKAVASSSKSRSKGARVEGTSPDPTFNVRPFLNVSQILPRMACR
ncbi:hypothetical protein M9H77_11796 [Catharanthus roseus]|uniref:Uncharacterized protein n=1 Tax=Catharanthus roseus TaxID=4058 RepID=A0ACC0BFM9_CATRO|nr:hypothetical protein M9H77_11796 [Catharanthus roseus]